MSVAARVTERPQPSLDGLANANDAAAADPGPVRLGELLRHAVGLSERDLQRIQEHSVARKMRFGDAAVALGLATEEQILQALTRQFRYPYRPRDTGQASSELIALTQPFTLQAESIRAIRSQLLLRIDPEGPRRQVLAVTSQSPGDGKTFFCANLAVTLAQLGGRTLLVDADLRGPRQHRLFGVDNSAGLSACLMGRPSAGCVQPSGPLPGLYVLPAGATPPNPLELVEGRAFGALLSDLAERFDHVVVDTPAAVYGADAQAIARRCGRVLIIARKDRSRLAELHSLSASIRATQAQLVGVVFNEFAAG